MTARPRPSVQYGGVLGALLVTALLAVSMVEHTTGRDPLDPSGSRPGQVVSDAATPDPTVAAPTGRPSASPTRSADRASRSTTRKPAATGSAWTEQVRACVMHRESRGNPRARRDDGGTASGLYGFIDSTWRSVTGRSDSAWQAPRAVQDAAFYELWDDGRGRSHWAPDAPGVRACF